MTSVCDVLVVVLVATTGPRLLVLKSTLTDVTHSGGIVVLQVTLTAGGENPLTFSALTVTVESENRPATCVITKNVAMTLWGLLCSYNTYINHQAKVSVAVCHPTSTQPIAE